jgi:sugar lactone lactonase YvrE
MTTTRPRYIWGPVNAEDLAPIPGTDWIITSGMTGPSAPIGRLYAVDRRDGSSSEICPYRLDLALDESRFGAQPALDPLAFEPHGIEVTQRADGTAELLVVNHGGRESVEYFEIDTSGTRPTLRWLGGVELPGTTVGNDVAALPGGGFVVSTTGDAAGRFAVTMEMAMGGGDTGGVMEWTPAGSWREIPGSQINTANGVAASADGEWVFVAGFATREIRKLRRLGDDPQAVTITTEILVDNLTWTQDGALLAAGPHSTTMAEVVEHHFSDNPKLALASRIIRLDPATMAVETAVEVAAEDFGSACTGLEVGDEIWVGAARDEGVARYPYRRS